MKKLFIVLAMLVAMSANAQWVQMSNGMGPINSVYAFAVSGSNIYAGTGFYDGVYLSTNNGTNWIQTALNNQYVRSLVTLGNYIFAGTQGNGIYLSTDNGSSWNQTALNDKAVYSLAVLGSNVFAGTTDSGVFISTNNGANWALTALNNKSIYSLAVSGTNIFAGTSTIQSSVYLSTNSGTSWVQTTLSNRLILALAANGNNIIAGTSGNGVYLSTNNGINWTQSLNNITVWSVAFSGNNILAGTADSGVYISTNNGTSWISKNQGLNSIQIVMSLLISNNYIFAGTYGSSIWRRPLSEIIGIKNISTETPSKYSLSQNYPNPFNPITNVKFSIVNVGNVKIVVYDVMGRVVQTLVNESLQPGTYEITFDGSKLTSGIYFYRIVTDSYTETKRMLLIK